eukprot:126054-Alexandrium_andersonii.AAC.1
MRSRGEGRFGPSGMLGLRPPQAGSWAPSSLRGAGGLQARPGRACAYAVAPTRPQSRAVA